MSEEEIQSARERRDRDDPNRVAEVHRADEVTRLSAPEEAAAFRAALVHRELSAKHAPNAANGAALAENRPPSLAGFHTELPLGSGARVALISDTSPASRAPRATKRRDCRASESS